MIPELWVVSCGIQLPVEMAMNKEMSLVVFAVEILKSITC